jgi:predicted phosphodiesterase
MRYLVLADIHSNLEALQSVVRHAKSQGGLEGVWCLGDIVGCGPDPTGCIDLLFSYPLAAVSGNHDLASIDAVPLKDFNAYAKAAIVWTQEQLIPEHRTFLRDNPLRREEEGVTLLHGTPRDPVWEYFLPSIMSTLDLAGNFQQFPTQCCLMGHSHIPFVRSEMGTGFPGLKSGQ